MKLLLVCNPGGHLSTMWRLKKFWSSHDREWVTYRRELVWRFLSSYIESLSRSQELSLSGRLVYSVVDEFYVQWIDCLEQYPKAKYKGIVI